MVDVVVSPDSLSLVGGPASINVDVDFGPAGTRGSQIFVGRGQPNNPSTVIGQAPNVLDLYINLASATVDEEYLNVYQYQSVDGSNIWVRLFDLIPETLSVKRLVNFGTGSESATIYVPVTDITPIVDGLTPENFNIQCTIEHPAPVALSIFPATELEEIDGVLNLPINIFATAYETLLSSNFGTLTQEWRPLSGTKTVNLFITMV